MKIRYDPDIDALLIELRDITPVSSIDYEPGVTAALDAHGLVIALEILDLRERVSPDDLNSLAETMHLLRSRANVERLLTSLERAKAREGAPTSPAKPRAELGLADE